MTKSNSYAVEKFLDGTYSVELADGRYLIFCKPGDKSNGFIPARIPGESRIYRFWKKSSWTLPDGTKSRWYVMTDSSLIGEAHNFIISAQVEVNEDGAIRRFEPKELQISAYDPNLAKGDESRPKQRDLNEVVRNALKNSGKLDEIIGNEAETAEQ